MNDALDNISQELKAELGRLTDLSGSLSAQLRTVDAQLKRVRQALKALTSKSVAISAKNSKPCVSKVEVVTIIEALLGTCEVISASDLRIRVEQEVVKTGKSRMGLALRIKEALAMPRFHETAEGVRMSNSGSAALHNPMAHNHAQISRA